MKVLAREADARWEAKESYLVQPEGLANRLIGQLKVDNAEAERAPEQNTIGAEKISASSPNCSEFMGKYNKSASAEQEVQEMKVKWNAQSHDPKIFPASTVVTEENFKAVVSMIGASGVGRDVFEIKIGPADGGKE